MFQYSDLPEADRTRILDDFRQATVRWNRLGRERADSEAEKEDEHKSHLIVVTDACLPLVGSAESPVSARVLINYELPTKKVCIFQNSGFFLSFFLSFFTVFSLSIEWLVLVFNLQPLPL